MSSLDEIKSRVMSLVFVLLACLLFPFPLNAETGKSAEEYSVKTAFLVNFAKLVEWPQEAFSSPDDSLKICIVGEDRFGAALDIFRGKTANNRKLIIRKFPDGEPASDCNVVFISNSEEGSLNSILGRLRDKPVLTVSDIRGFENKGGIIAFFLQDTHLKFRVNIDAAGRANLKISSYLLELAENVRGRRGKE